MKRFLLPLAAVAIVGLLLPNVKPAYACSCTYLTPEEELQQADLVVVGTVSDVTFEGPIDEIARELELGHGVAHRPDTSGLLRMRVERYLKGDGDDHVTVEQKAIAITKNLDGSVSVEFTGGPNCALFSGIPLNERYLLFLYQNENDAFGTSWCLGSLRLDLLGLSYAFASRDSYVARLAEYDAAFGLPPGAFADIADSPLDAPLHFPVGGGSPTQSASSTVADPLVVTFAAVLLVSGGALALYGLRKT